MSLFFAFLYLFCVKKSTYILCAKMTKKIRKVCEKVTKRKSEKCIYKWRKIWYNIYTWRAMKREVAIGMTSDR